MPLPLVTVVIPTYNQRPEILRDAVSSAAGQSIPTEVIVVDDGSTNPVLLLAPPRVIRHPENKGISAALNTGIRAMRSDWFAWLSSDDVFDPKKLEKQLAACEERNAKAAFCAYVVVDPEGNVIGYNRPPMGVLVEKQILGTFPTLYQWPNVDDQMRDFGAPGGCFVNGSTCLIHKSVFDEVGLFDEDLLYGQDWDMWCRIGRKHRWLYVNETLGLRREGHNLTQRMMSDEKMRARRDEEDRLILRRYGQQ